MANFILGWNFSLANRAEISAQLLKQILLKSNCRLHGERFSPGRNSAWAKKILAQYFQTGLGFPAKRAEKSMYSLSLFQPRLKKEREHMYLLCFCTSVNFHVEICILRPGWNWACNHNNVSAQWAERNFSPGWNSTCNQALKLLYNKKIQLSTGKGSNLKLHLCIDLIKSTTKNSVEIVWYNTVSAELNLLVLVWCISLEGLEWVSHPDHQHQCRMGPLHIQRAPGFYTNEILLFPYTWPKRDKSKN